MATRSMPIVSCRSIGWATATLVPTPSVEVASSGRRYRARALASNRPAKPPSPPTTSGRVARATDAFISSTARSPASMSTPACGVAAHRRSLTGGSARPRRPRRRPAWPGPRRRREPRGRAPRAGACPAAPARAAAPGSGRRSRRGRAGPPGTRGRRDELLERDVRQRVGADGLADLVDREAVRDQLGAARRSRCRRSTATSPAATEIRTCTSAAPASRSIRTRARWVLPRTIESSTTTSRLPAITSRRGFSFSRMPELADRLGRLDEGAADVGVLDQALAEGDAGLLA